MTSYTNDLKTYITDTPGLTLQDVFKWIYQSSFRPEHMAADYARVLAYINAELPAKDADLCPAVEPLGGGFVRFHLKALSADFTPEKLAGAFVASAAPVPGGAAQRDKWLDALRALSAAGEIPFLPAQADAAIDEWCKTGFAPLHHSDAYRDKYHPAYRVVKKELL